MNTKRLTQKNAPNEEFKQMLKLINKLKRSQKSLWETIKNNTEIKSDENENNI